MQIRVGIKEDDKDVICRAETELIMSQLKRKNTDITFKKYSIKQEERCNQSNSWLDAVSWCYRYGHNRYEKTYGVRYSIYME